MTFLAAALTGTLLAALAQADMPQARSQAMGCKASCEAHVKQPGLRANICNRCFMGALSVNDRGAWVIALGAAEGGAEGVTSALADPDWEVRWGAVRALSKQKGQAELSALASWIVKAQGDDGKRARLTAAHLAGKRKLTSSTLLKVAGKDGPAAAAAVWEDRAAIRRTLEVELYGTDPFLQLEALQHLALFLSIPEGQVVLEAMRGKPESTDVIPARLLIRRAELGGPPAGLTLLKGAREEHKPFVDRLFALYSAQLDLLRPKLASKDLEERKATVREVWSYGPLGAFDLEQMLLDEVNTVRLLAARGVAAGEGLTLLEAAKNRLSPQSKTPALLQTRWIDVLGESGGKGCDEPLIALVKNQALSDGVRGAAVKGLGACGGAESFKTIVEALDNSAPAIRVGAIQALQYMPRNTRAEAAAAKALTDPDPTVLAAAVRTVGTQRQAGRVEQVRPLLDHADPGVRAAAVEALATLGGSSSVISISRRLKDDRDASVRVAAAKALGELGGPHAPGALGEAAKKDPDSRVQHVALESLRRLGFR